jgi:hypothetical protein
VLAAERSRFATASKSATVIGNELANSGPGFCAEDSKHSWADTVIAQSCLDHNVALVRIS